jgi:hypothetical protein
MRFGLLDGCDDHDGLLLLRLLAQESREVGLFSRSGIRCRLDWLTVSLEEATCFEHYGNSLRRRKGMERSARRSCR